MVRRTLIVSLSLVLLVPAAMVAQERAQPQERAPQQQMQQQMQQGVTLAVSYWKCDWREMDSLLESAREVMNPVWERMMNDGLLIGAGVFTHNWGDEWNFNMYRIAPDEQTFFRAYEAEGQAIQQQLADMGIDPESPGPIQEHCTEHKDNIYTMYPGPEAPAPQQ